MANIGLGSLLSPVSQEQLESFYEYKKKQNYMNETKEEFIKDYNNQQEIARNDQEELKKLGMTPQEVAKKLADVIKRAEPFFEDSWGSRGSKDYDADIGEYIVGGMDKRILKLSADDCPLCTHVVTGGVKYRITNKVTAEKILFSGLTWHCIEKHNYFTNPQGPYRLDPSRVCKLFEL
jgi:hypothetical protein